MNSDPQENFDTLRKLLALKRHEQPPPGYFNELPRKIWTRIEKGDAEPSFWAHIFPSVGLRPAVAYAFALVVCGTLIVGIGSALKSEPPTPVSINFEQEQTVQVLPAPQVNVAQQGNTLALPISASSTNPVMPEAPLYPGNIKLDVQPAAFTPNQ